MSLPNQSDDWGFRITNEGCGFQIRFASGYILSVQFGPFHYCNNRLRVPTGMDGKLADTFAECGAVGSPNAEVAIIDPDGNFVPWKDDDVSGYVTPEDMLVMAMACGLWGMQKNSKEDSNE